MAFIYLYVIPVYERQTGATGVRDEVARLVEKRLKRRYREEQGRIASQNAASSWNPPPNGAQMGK